MAIQLKKTTEKATYLSPVNNFQPAVLEVEKRYDPLTGDVSLIVPFKNFSLPPVDWTGAIADSLNNKCPFCPENKGNVTPRFTRDFLTDGRIAYNRATVIPNLSPYERYSAVVIMSDDHYLAWHKLSPDIISDAFWAGLTFLEKCAGHDPQGAKYCSINWNYMPYSGGTLIHPHLQVLAGPGATNYHKRALSGEVEYFNTFSSNFWPDFTAYEKEQAERYIGATFSLHWVAAFAPKALADVIVVFDDCKSIKHIDKSHFDNLACGLGKFFNYFSHYNIPSFNFSLFINIEENKYSLVTGRLVGRFPLIPPAGSDMSYLQVLHDTPWTVLKPEELKNSVHF